MPADGFPTPHPVRSAIDASFSSRVPEKQWGYWAPPGLDVHGSKETEYDLMQCGFAESDVYHWGQRSSDTGLTSSCYSRRFPTRRLSSTSFHQDPITCSRSTCLASSFAQNAMEPANRASIPAASSNSPSASGNHRRSRGIIHPRKQRKAQNYGAGTDTD